MSLFEFRPYKTDSLTSSEIAAVSASCEVIIDAGGDADIRNAYAHFKKGSLSRTELSKVIAATAACLEGIRGKDDLKTAALRNETVALMAKALEKLLKML